MSEITRTLMVDVWTNKPISEDEIHKAYYLSMQENADRPTELVMGVEACAEFNRFIDIARMADINTYMGMKWRCDGEMDDNKWFVRRSVPKTYALKDTV